MKSLFAALVALAIVWPQMIFSCASVACGAATCAAKCACSEICCPSDQPTQQVPLALPAGSTEFPTLSAIPEAAAVLRLEPVQTALLPAPVAPPRVTAVPLFLLNCTQLI